MAQCPDNSTECLLRAILDANSGYNWNPLIFGTTAAIGVLALVVSMTTVFQGLLGAGPGRLKASRQAIGRWSRDTKHQFNWTEFRVVTTAKVPFINLDNLVGNSHEDFRNKLFPSSSRNISQSLGQTTQQYPATWLNLLEFLGLGSVEFDSLPCKTDYLPSDVQAAPAFATMKSIMLLAAAAGCDTIETKEEYSQAIGPSMQLEIRPHPQLGTIASYNRFPGRPTYEQNPVAFWELCLFAEGNFKYRSSNSIGIRYYKPELGNSSIILKDLKLKSGSCRHRICEYVDQDDHSPLQAGDLPLCLLASDSSILARAFPLTKMEVHDALVKMCGFCKNWKQNDADFIRNGLNALVGAGNLRTLYPKEFNRLPLIGDRCEQRTVPYSYPPEPISLGWSWLPPENVYPGIDRKRPKWDKSGVADLIIVWDALHLCLKWINSESTNLIAVSNPKTKTFNRKAVGFQLQEVDYWLMQNGGQEASCQLQLLLSECVSGILGTEPPEPHQGDIPLKEGMRTLLMYRAALFATLLATAVDNSVLLDTELGQRIVQFV